VEAGSKLVSRPCERRHRRKRISRLASVSRPLTVNYLDLTLKKLFILIAVNSAAGLLPLKPLDVIDVVRRKTPTQQDAADLRTARPGPRCFLLYISVGLVAGLLGSALQAFPRGPKVLNSLLSTAGLEREDRLYRGTHYLALL